MKSLSLLLLLGVSALAQPPARIIFVTVDPAGSCNTGAALQWNTSSGNLWGCSAGTWTKIAGSTGAGTVTSVAATAPVTTTPNPITTTGTIACATCTTNAGAQTLTNKDVTSGTNTFPTFNQNTTGTASNVTGVVSEANGGTGVNNTVGAAGHVLRSNNTHYVDSAIQAGDVPTLNQNTTGTASNLSGTPALPNGTTGTTQAGGDATTKLATDAFVSNAIAGINPAVAVQACTTAAGDTSGLTYFNGVAGIGASLTGTNNTAIVIDGFTFTAVNQRLLVKNDTQSPSGAFNGVYYLSQLQGVALPPILIRALDYDQPSDINNTGAIPCVNGTVNGGTSWYITSTVNTVGTDPLTFAQFSINPSTIVTTSRNINTNSPLGGGGNLSSDLTLTCTTCSTTTPASITSGTFASIPGTCTHTSTQSDIYYITDSIIDQALCTATNTWTYFNHAASGVAVTPPPTGGWTWDNQGSSTIVFTHGPGLMVAATNAGDQIRVQYRTAPVVAYTITARIQGDWSCANGGSLSTRRCGAGLALSDSTGKYVTFTYLNDIIDSGNWVVQTYKNTNATTLFTGAYNSLQNPSLLSAVSLSYKFLQISDDLTTNLTFRLSIDGETWQQFDQRSRTDFLASGPTRVAWFTFAPQGSPAQFQLVDWTVTTP